MPVLYDSRAVANYFLSRKQLTQLELHKLIYFAHGWHLALRGKPLIDEFVEAWMYGPVIPTVYHEFKDFGASPISRFATDFNPLTGRWDRIPTIDADDQATERLLERVWTVYKVYSSGQLIRLTHERGTPWSETRAENGGIKNANISNELIRRFFVEKMNAADQE